MLMCFRGQASSTTAAQPFNGNKFYLPDEGKIWIMSNTHWINSSDSYWKTGTDFSSLKYSFLHNTEYLFTCLWTFLPYNHYSGSMQTCYREKPCASKSGGEVLGLTTSSRLWNPSRRRARDQQGHLKQRQGGSTPCPYVGSQYLDRHTEAAPPPTAPLRAQHSCSQGSAASHNQT